MVPSDIYHRISSTITSVHVWSNHRRGEVCQWLLQCVTLMVVVCHNNLYSVALYVAYYSGTAFHTGLALFSCSSSIATLLYHWLILMWCNDDVMLNYVTGRIDHTACTSSYPKSIAAFCDPTLKLMFGHFLRDAAGRGDTIDKYGITLTFTHLHTPYSILNALGWVRYMVYWLSSVIIPEWFLLLRLFLCC